MKSDHILFFTPTEKYIETEKHLLIYSKSDESNKELRELKTKVSRLEELLSQQGISPQFLQTPNLMGNGNVMNFLVGVKKRMWSDGMWSDFIKIVRLGITKVC